MPYRLRQGAEAARRYGAARRRLLAPPSRWALRTTRAMWAAIAIAGGESVTHPYPHHTCAWLRGSAA